MQTTAASSRNGSRGRGPAPTSPRRSIPASTSASPGTAGHDVPETVGPRADLPSASPQRTPPAAPANPAAPASELWSVLSLSRPRRAPAKLRRADREQSQSPGCVRVGHDPAEPPQPVIYFLGGRWLGQPRGRNAGTSGCRGAARPLQHELRAKPNELCQGHILKTHGGWSPRRCFGHRGPPREAAALTAWAGRAARRPAAAPPAPWGCGLS